MFHHRRFRSRLIGGATAALVVLASAGSATAQSTSPPSPAASKPVAKPSKAVAKPGPTALQGARPGKAKPIVVADEAARLAGADVDAAVAAAKALGDSTDRAAREALLEALALGVHPK